MNERLRELMLEAGYAAPEIAGRALKLSELLIQDCLDILDDEDDGGFEGRSVRIASVRIKELFGIEE